MGTVSRTCLMGNTAGNTAGPLRAVARGDGRPARCPTAGQRRGRPGASGRPYFASAIAASTSYEEKPSPMNRSR